MDQKRSGLSREAPPPPEPSGQGSQLPESPPSRMPGAPEAAEEDPLERLHRLAQQGNPEKVQGG